MSRPKGSILTQIHKDRIGEKLKGNKNGRFAKGKHIITDKIRKNMSESHIGKFFPNEGQWRKGQPAWNKGKKMPNSMGRKMSIIASARIGDKAAGWLGGISFEPYSTDWTNELRESIRERDNYICQKCGKTQEEELSLSHKRLTIHHKDYNKKNCSEENLVTVCNSCNLKLNSKFYREGVETLWEIPFR